MSGWLAVAMMAAVAVAVAVAPLVIARFVAPRRPGPEKQATYECGLVSRGDAWIPVRAQYFVVALVFLIFDIEAVFLFPWAVVYRELGPGAVGAMALFLAMLTGGLAWAWNRGHLEWK